MFQGFPDKTEFFLDQPFDDGIDMRGIQQLLHFGEFQLFFDEQGLCDDKFVIVQVGELIARLLIEYEDRLAIEFEMRGQCGRHRLPFAAEIIVRDPFP